MTIWMLEDIQFEIVWDDQRLNPPNFGTREWEKGTVFQ